MIVTCEECNARFNLDESLLKETGSKVRCSLCKHVFTAYPEPPEVETEDTPIPEVADDAGEPAALNGDEDLEAVEIDFPEMDESDEPLEEVGEEIASDELDDVVKMFEMEEDEEASIEKEAADADIPDLGLDLDESEALELPDEELDLSEMDGLLEDDSGLSGDDEEESDELDLDLDLGLEDATEEESAEDEDATLDLDLDLGESGSDEELEEDTEGELDFSNLEDMLEMDDGALDEAGDDTEELDLDFDLEADESGLEESASEDDEEELDLSDMEDMLAMEEEPDAESAGEETDTLDLDLDFELDELDDQEQPEAEADDELDLSDMEELLEADDAVETDDDLSDESLEELELDLGEAGDTEEQLEESDDEELELSDLEDMLEMDEDVEVMEDDEEESAIEDESLDLADLEEMMEAGEAAEGDVEFVDDPAGDMLDLKDQGSAETDADDQLLPIDAPLPIEDESPVGSFDLDDGYDEDEPEAFNEALYDVDEPDASEKKKGISKPILILLILLLAGGGVYGGYFAMTTMGIEVPFIAEFGSKIPFVGEFFKPPVEDDGNLKISTLGISGKFVNSPKAGKLFVITGKARNGYDHARGMVKIVGKLYSKGKKLAKTETVFCGNSLTEEELNSLDFAAIQKQLKVRAGKKKSNMKIVSGRMIPFMVVFSDLPENLDEYTIEVVESFKAL